MSRTITMYPNQNANGDVGGAFLTAGGTFVISSQLAHELVNRGKAFFTMPSFPAPGVAFVAPRTTAQLAGTPPAEDISLAYTTEFVDSLDSSKRYTVNAAGTAYAQLAGSGGSSTLAGLADVTTYDLGSNNASVAAIKATANAAAPGTTIIPAGNHTLLPTDSGGVANNTAAATITVNAGLGATFGCAFTGVGVLTFNGTATIADYRTSGSTHPACSLVPTAVLNAYELYGTKA